jgi:hypothetical protein
VGIKFFLLFCAAKEYSRNRKGRIARDFQAKFSEDDWRNDSRYSQRIEGIRPDRKQRNGRAVHWPPRNADP